MYSKTFDRILSTIFGMSDQILLGQGGDRSSASRIDLIYRGLQKFMESPIIGGTPYLEGGIHTHFFVVDTIMGMGIFGIVILAVYFTTIFRVYIFSYKSLDDSKIWILLIASCFFSQQFFHGRSPPCEDQFSGYFRSYYYNPSRKKPQAQIRARGFWRGAPLWRPAPHPLLELLQGALFDAGDIAAQLL